MYNSVRPAHTYLKSGPVQPHPSVYAPNRYPSPQVLFAHSPEDINDISWAGYRRELTRTALRHENNSSFNILCSEMS